MALGLQAFLPIRDDRFYVFDVEGVSAAEVHPCTAFMAHDLLCREWQDILESGMTWEEVEEYKPVCAWAGIWSDATNAALEAACRDLPSGAIDIDVRIDWAGNKPYEACQSHIKLNPELIEAHKGMDPPPKAYRFSGFFE